MSEFVKIGDVASVLQLIKKSDIPKKPSFTNDKKTINGVFILSGIVLGFIPVTIAGLFVTAYLQYRRGDQLNL